MASMFGNIQVMEASNMALAFTVALPSLYPIQAILLFRFTFAFFYSDDDAFHHIISCELEKFCNYHSTSTITCTTKSDTKKILLHKS